MWGLDAPTAVSWPAGPGTNFLLDVYDWDTVTVGPVGAGAALTSRVVLCTAFYPCALTVRGRAQLDGALQLAGAGGISCSAAVGCTNLEVQLLTLSCNGQAGADTLIEVR